MLKAAGYTAVEGYGALYADEAKVARADRATSPTAASRCRPATSRLDMLEQRARPRARDRQGARHRDDLLPLPAARPAPRQRRRLRRLRPAPAGGRQAAPRRRPRLRLAQPRLRVRASCPTASIPQVAIFEGGPDLEWEADLAWVIKGGADPLEWIKTFGKRLTAVHIKDIAPAGENADEDGWADVGHGTVDWKGADGGAALDARQVLRHGARQPQGRRRASPSARSPRPASSEDRP